VGDGTDIQSKLAFFNKNRNRRLGLLDGVASCKVAMQKQNIAIWCC